LGLSNWYCYSVAINQNLSRIYTIKNLFKSNFTQWYTFIIATHTTSPAILSFIAPYTGTAVGEFVRDNGHDVCCCYDDFSKHAKVYRQFSLIISVLAARDCYPSDSFNIHSALLERSTKLKYSGTITAFPIIETINSDISE